MPSSSPQNGVAPRGKRQQTGVLQKISSVFQYLKSNPNREVKGPFWKIILKVCLRVVSIRLMLTAASVYLLLGCVVLLLYV